MDSGSHRSAVRPEWRAEPLVSPSSQRSAREALAAQVIEVVLPIGVPVAAELEEIIPAVDAGRMHVVEDEPRRVVADRMHFEDGDIFFPRNSLALVRRMALNLRTRALDPQIFGGQVEGLAV